MEILDIVCIVFALLMAVLGFRKGFIISLATLVALVLGVYFAVYFSHVAERLLRETFDLSGAYLPAVSFAVTFLAVLILILLTGKLIEKLVSVVGLGFLNHLAGAILGLVKSILILSVIFYILSLSDPHQKLITPKAREQSLFYEKLASVLPTLMKWTGTQLTFPGIQE